MDSLAGEPAVVTCENAFGVALRDRRGIGIHRVQQELHGDRAAALEVARVVVGNHHAGIQLVAAERVADLVDREVVARRLKALTLGQRGDQLAAFRGLAVVDHAQADVRDGGAQSKAEEHQLQRGREDQGDGQPAVAPNLAELLLHQRPDAIIENALEESLHGYAFTCIRRSVRQASSSQYARCCLETAKFLQLAQVDGSRRSGLGPVVLPRHALCSWR